MRIVGASLAPIVLALGVTGCTYTIAFSETDTDWHYQTDATRQSGTALVAVIDEKTLAESYDFSSFTTGAANTWVVQYGLMLQQVADVALPQMVEHYGHSTTYKEPAHGHKRLTLVMTVPSYSFADFHAKLTMHVDAYGSNRTRLFSKDYAGEGGAQGAKMFWAGAFGQKSAVRESSLDAFRQAFSLMQPDVISALGREAALAAAPVP